MDQGLPPRDPAAPRTPIEPYETLATEVFVAPEGYDAISGQVLYGNIFYCCGQMVRRPQHMDLLENAVFGDKRLTGHSRGGKTALCAGTVVALCQQSKHNAEPKP